jgi:hypothetical protein
MTHCKNLCKCHNVPPHSIKIKVKNKIKCTLFFRKKKRNKTTILLQIKKKENFQIAFTKINEGKEARKGRWDEFFSASHCYVNIFKCFYNDFPYWFQRLSTGLDPL